MSDIKLEIKDLHKFFDIPGKRLHILKGINLTVKKGEIVAILGPSGSGKSTLLHILGTLIRPTEGNVYIENTDVFSLCDEELSALRNKKIGFIFQFHYLLPEFTALENVMIPMMIQNDAKRHPERSEGSQNNAVKLLENVGLAERLSHNVNELSGGEQQRVAIARALSCNPELLLADEPTGNLDKETANSVKDILWNLVRQENKTLIIVTHNEDLAKSSDRIVHLIDGKIY